MLGKLVGGIGSFRKILLSQRFESFAPIHGHEDVGHERNECLVSADIRRGFLAANVLLASGESKHIAPFAVTIMGFTDQAAGHLTDIFFFGRDYTGVRTAKSEGY